MKLKYFKHLRVAEMQTWKIGQHNFQSRLLMGTGAFPSVQIMMDSLQVSECELVTIAMRRVSKNPDAESFFDLLTKAGYKLLPNTAGCHTAQEAVMTAELAREALDTSLVKLEVIGDEDTLLPDPLELIKAARELVSLGFTVLPYTNDDLITALRLQDAGCAAVMPLAAPIGSGLGIRNQHNLEMMRNRISVPLIVDAGIGTASDAAIAMELGCDAVLLNSAVARAENPVMMAQAMKQGVEAGYLARHARRMPKKEYAQSASPLEGRAKLSPY